ncbi:WbqC family protein [uncultured Eudoraea sp.]|uniref:WbqC family protein n=1 Tax=uncultured Eudoraea sp. TaxID=1035614 RepID=UPI002606FE9A|nr:WbqC family protein [uncultured Eudoraea sp.]
MKKILITQSNYIPWKGYFDSIQNCDVFVVYDEMQYTKLDWRNRNKIKSNYGIKWLTIPVKTSGKYFQKINDTKIADKNWNIDHWNKIREYYKNANCFNEMAEWIEPLYRNCEFEYLSEINFHFIKAINSFMGIETEIRFSSEF